MSANSNHTFFVRQLVGVRCRLQRLYQGQRALVPAYASGSEKTADLCGKSVAHSS